LSAFPDVNTRVVEQKSGPLRLGQADGIACRTMEMFEAFGCSERVLKEAHWVNETTFWNADDRHRERIVRHGRIQDAKDGLSECPELVLNQGRVNDFYLNLMRTAPSRLEPAYSRRLLDLQIDLQEDSVPKTYPVKVRLQRVDDGNANQIETIRARYVV